MATSRSCCFTEEVPETGRLIKISSRQAYSSLTWVAKKPESEGLLKSKILDNSYRARCTPATLDSFLFPLEIMDLPKESAPQNTGATTVRVTPHEKRPLQSGHQASVPPWLSLMETEEPDDLASPLPPGAPSVASLEGKIPDVEVLEFKGQGSMGWVYQARLQPFTRVLALKLLRTDCGFGPEAQRQFEMEAKILADLEQHEGLVRCYKMGRKSNGGELYYLSDWVEGQNLAEVLAAHDPHGEKGLPLDDALNYIIQAGEALQAAHEQKVLHRDLKPSNLMLTSKGKVKVVDFGLALQSSEYGFLNVFMDGCSPSYAAPEQIGQGGGTVTERTDVYGLAATLYHLITGRCPVGWCQNPSVLSNVGTSVDEVLRRAMSANQADRPTMREFVADLQRLRGGGQDVGQEWTVVLLKGTDETWSGQLPKALKTLNASPGVQRIPSDEPAVLVAKCRTPSSGAALGLRWLQDCPENRLGLATGTKIQALDMAKRLAWLAHPGQLLAPQRTLDSLRSQGLPDPTSPENGGALFHLHGCYTWPDNTPDGGAVTEVVGQIHSTGATARDPFLPPLGAADAKPVLDTEAMWQAGAQLAVGAEVPHCPGWILQKQLGAGGYGEVWLAAHPAVMDARVFKFCGDAARLAAFRNEAEILRYLGRTLPEEPGFARLLAEQLASAPFWLQMEYCPLGNLAHWLAVPEGAPPPADAVRVQLLSQTARLVALAHGVGVIHRDLKPANILIVRGREAGTVWPLLTDFGLSGLDDDLLVPGTAGDTPLHHSQPQLLRAGTRLYAAPEQATSPKSDVYALGVILYQILTGRLHQRPEEGWKDEVKDPLLRGDIAAAIHKDPDQRVSASVLSERLNQIGQRRIEHERGRVRRWVVGGVLATAALGVTAGALAWALQHVVREKEAEMQKRYAAEAEAQRNASLKSFGQAMLGLSKFVDYTQLKQEAGGYVGQIKAMADAMVQLERNPDSSAAALDLPALTSRVEYQMGIINMLNNFAAQPETQRVQWQLAEAALKNSRRGEQLAPPEDVDFVRHVMHNAMVVGQARLKAEPEPDVTGAYAAFAEAAEAMRRLTRSQKSNQSDFLLGLPILETMATLREQDKKLAEAKALWGEVQALAVAGSSIGSPLPPDADPFKRCEIEASQKVRELEKRLEARQGRE